MCLPRIGYAYDHRGRHIGLPLPYIRLESALIANCFHIAIALSARQIFSFIFQFSIFHITFVIYHCRSRLERAMVYDKHIWKMRQQKLPHRSFTLAPALPDISLGLPFSPGMTISSTRKSSRQSWIYTDILSNANAPLPVKGEYILSWHPRRSVLEGAGVRLEHQTCSTTPSLVGAAGP
jgi:hypothetical protein